MLQRMKVGLWGWVPLSCLVGLFASACGGSDGDDVPDSGYGAQQAVPAISCDALCTREGDCSEHLCIENTNNPNLMGFGSAVAAICKAQCNEAALASSINAQQWNCMFQSSCRAAVVHDVCHINASFYCQ